MPPVAPDQTSLAARLDSALRSKVDDGLQSLSNGKPVDARDRFLCLEMIYALHLAPVDLVDEQVRWQHHPVVAALKRACEDSWLRELDQAVVSSSDDIAPLAAIRRLAAHDRLPSLYWWLAQEASPTQLRQFLALEGGPDGGFDDLVALCQVGLDGQAKSELARNYWDEMGNGDLAGVHTQLHQQLVRATGLDAISLATPPVSALARSCLGGMLATNRAFQPEMLGALGLTELQAGPRSRLVLQAFDRCAIPEDAYRFYRVHADVDPRHGADWLKNVIAPLVDARPEWGPRIVRGARWRSSTNADFFRDAAMILSGSAEPRARRSIFRCPHPSLLSAHGAA